jgi:hypothetical protein
MDQTPSRDISQEDAEKAEGRNSGIVLLGGLGGLCARQDSRNKDDRSLMPPLTPAEESVARTEGWILGVG